MSGGDWETEESLISSAAFLDNDLDKEGDRIYDKWNNFHQTVALVSALFLTFIYSLDGSTIDLDGQNVCNGFAEWLAVEENFKLSNADDGGCEAGCNNVWKTCAKSYQVAMWYRTLCYVAVLGLGLATMSAVRMILVLSSIPDDKISKWTEALGFSTHIPGALCFFSFLVFLLTGVMQASLVSPPHHFWMLMGMLALVFLGFGFIWCDTQRANSAVARD
jgi:hypothetical protein